MSDWTIQKLLNWTADYFVAKNLDSPRLTAELLLSHVLELQRIELYTNFEQTVGDAQLAQLREMIKRCAEKEPIDYVIGKTQFYSLQFNISADCLIPRPETELLVERAIEFLRSRKDNCLVLDLCTGSGCIAAAIAKNVPDCKITAADISAPALKIADKNIKRYSLADRIELLKGDLFEPITEHKKDAKFDLIVSNPPYVSTTEMNQLDKNVKDYEPKIALHAGTKGLDIHRRIIDSAAEFLKPSAALMIEIGCRQAQAVKEMLEKTGCFAEIKIEKDLTGHDRVITGIKTA